MVKRINGGSDVHWNVVNDRAETIYNIAASLQSQTGRHYMVRQMCEHVANHSQAIVALNLKQLPGYKYEHDDNISVMCDRIGTILRDEALVRGIPDAHLAIMRAGVSAIRGALFARQGQQMREAEAARFEQPERLRAVA